MGALQLDPQEAQAIRERGLAALRQSVQGQKPVNPFERIDRALGTVGRPAYRFLQGASAGLVKPGVQALASKGMVQPTVMEELEKPTFGGAVAEGAGYLVGLPAKGIGLAGRVARGGVEAGLRHGPRLAQRAAPFLSRVAEGSASGTAAGLLAPTDLKTRGELAQGGAALGAGLGATGAALAPFGERARAEGGRFLARAVGLAKRKQNVRYGQAIERAGKATPNQRVDLTEEFARLRELFRVNPRAKAVVETAVRRVGRPGPAEAGDFTQTTMRHLLENPRMRMGLDIKESQAVVGALRKVVAPKLRGRAADYDEVTGEIADIIDAIQAKRGDAFPALRDINKTFHEGRNAFREARRAGLTTPATALDAVERGLNPVTRQEVYKLFQPAGKPTGLSRRMRAFERTSKARRVTGKVGASIQGGLSGAAGGAVASGLLFRRIQNDRE